MNSQVLLVVAVLFASVSITNGEHIKAIRSQRQFDSSCSLKYIKHGCYKDKSKPSLRTLKELIFQDRYKGKTFSGQKISWKNWATYLPELVCRCAMAASKKGYVYFGIQFYGECWSSADAESRFHMYGATNNCVNTDYNPCDDQASNEACAGANHSNYVYEIVKDFPDGSATGPPIEPQEY
ncbi:uncharacterized protein [Porites lutea]|uniref:uncharacterized protein n=1 Tax=Porites lutea TaxID=51062 RepID=UPI003CC55DE0